MLSCTEIHAFIAYEYTHQILILAAPETLFKTILGLMFVDWFTLPLNPFSTIM